MGSLIAAVALAGALFLHNTPLGPTYLGTIDLGDGGGSPSIHLRASWQDPLALLIVVAGLGLAAAVLSSLRRS
jgi:hypothetical protein